MILKGEGLLINVYYIIIHYSDYHIYHISSYIIVTNRPASITLSDGALAQPLASPPPPHGGSGRLSANASATSPRNGLQDGRDGRLPVPSAILSG